MSVQRNPWQRLGHPAGRRCAFGRAAWVAVLLGLMLAAQPATAARHALLMAIGNYAEPSARLKGIEHDLQLAQQMAQAWGASADRTTVLRDKQLSFVEMRNALRTLAMNVNPGDEVLVYFTGHGVRRTRAGSPGCQEGLVTYEGRVLVDEVLLDHLQAIAQRARRVVAMADTCHAGGLATKSLERGLGDDSQPKYYPAELLPDLKDAKAGANGQTVDACAVQVNVPKALTRDISPGHILYLGAAADDEAAFATPDGSLATRAWASCLKTNAHATGRELARCAQEWIDRQQPRRQQTITPSLNPDLRWMD